MSSTFSPDLSKGYELDLDAFLGLDGNPTMLVLVSKGRDGLPVIGRCKIFLSAICIGECSKCCHPSIGGVAAGIKDF